VRFDVAGLAARLPARPRTRFAPSPTGFLHLGHTVNAIYTWGVARALGGVVVLRIEDHDRERSRPEYERAILEDLEWLGFAPDESDGTPGAVCRQSDREAIYRRALDTLRAKQMVFACRCSRKAIVQAGGTRDGDLWYPGTCPDVAAAIDTTMALRVRIDPGTERFEDARRGWQEQTPATQCGDVLIRDRVGQWTYQFAVTVDDFEQQIDLVIRGDDLLASTGRQIRLARLLGRPQPPVFLHHPLVFAAPGVKLSKSNRDTGIRELRAAGLTARDVLGLAAARCGLLATSRSIAATELASLFG
jgi:glutamyl-tRNA synthetase/glutamyl-Q tRNA(Asp) synthetase